MIVLRKDSEQECWYAVATYQRIGPFPSRMAASVAAQLAGTEFEVMYRDPTTDFMLGPYRQWERGDE